MREKNFSSKATRNKGNFRKIVLTSVIIATSGISIFIGNRLTAKGFLPITTNSELKESFNQIDDISKYKKLFDIRQQIYQYYDGEIDEEKLVEGAIKGMTMGLNDPYSYYMNKDEYEKFMESNSGEYMGVGMQVGIDGDDMVVKEPLEGGPAESAGVKKGDIIKAINGVPMTSNDLEKAVSMMKGKEKAEIVLTLERADKGIFDLKVMRDTVKTINVKGEMLNDTVGYIKVKAFEENVANDFNKKLEELQSSGMKGLVLDLRGNGGGYMSECVELVSNFIPKGEEIVSTIDKYGNKEKSLSIGGKAYDLPLVVLVDKESASASEIVAGAIKDYEVGTLVGTTTFGKGIVQMPVKQNDGGALKITISKYYTPSGENIHGKGIPADIEVEYPKELRNKEYDKNTDPQLQKALEVMSEKIK